MATLYDGRVFARKPSPFDERDFQLGDYLPSLSLWRRIVNLIRQPAYPCKLWQVTAVLDQGDTPHCVGFSGADWGNTLPVNDKWPNQMGHTLYYECKVIDKEPHAEDGSTIRSISKVLQNRKRLKTYAFASSLNEVKQAITSLGPILCGTNWYSGMMKVDSKGFIRPTGGVVGGHAYLMVGYDPAQDAFCFLNSWGTSWGLRGCFWMKTKDFEKLRKAQGECSVAVELPI